MAAAMEEAEAGPKEEEEADLADGEVSSCDEQAEGGAHAQGVEEEEAADWEADWDAEDAGGAAKECVVAVAAAAAVVPAMEAQMPGSVDLLAADPSARGSELAVVALDEDRAAVAEATGAAEEAEGTVAEVEAAAVEAVCAEEDPGEASDGSSQSSGEHQWRRRERSPGGGGGAAQACGTWTQQKVVSTAQALAAAARLRALTAQAGSGGALAAARGRGGKFKRLGARLSALAARQHLAHHKVGAGPMMRMAPVRRDPRLGGLPALQSIATGAGMQGPGAIGGAGAVGSALGVPMRVVGRPAAAPISPFALAGVGPRRGTATSSSVGLGRARPPVPRFMQRSGQGARPPTSLVGPKSLQGVAPRGSGYLVPPRPGTTASAAALLGGQRAVPLMNPRQRRGAPQGLATGVRGLAGSQPNMLGAVGVLAGVAQQLSRMAGSQVPRPGSGQLAVGSGAPAAAPLQRSMGWRPSRTAATRPGMGTAFHVPSFGPAGPAARRKAMAQLAGVTATGGVGPLAGGCASAPSAAVFRAGPLPRPGPIGAAAGTGPIGAPVDTAPAPAPQMPAAPEAPSGGKQRKRKSNESLQRKESPARESRKVVLRARSCSTSPKPECPKGGRQAGGGSGRRSMDSMPEHCPRSSTRAPRDGCEEDAGGVGRPSWGRQRQRGGDGDRGSGGWKGGSGSRSGRSRWRRGREDAKDDRDRERGPPTKASRRG
mmetsp:Transcript_61221/g.192680  ORF Transcript_61221/g.192680 Transcript_61221/m.192680 type:complete len:713 (-) Transcript_61221:244-2382(-)